MEVLRHDDVDPAPLDGKRIAILGYGNQGRAQALNLKDGGFDVIVGLRASSASASRAAADGLTVATPADAASGADLVMLLSPDETHAALYQEVAGDLRKGAALGFSHGLAVHFGLIEPREDLDVILVAPKGPGTALRSLYEAGSGLPALWAVAQDATGNAAAIAYAYGRAIGSARAGLLPTSFQEEAEADLFNEQAVVWGAVPAILAAGFETLVEAGFSEEIAYMECVGELKLLAELIDKRGIAGMREVISRAAALGAALGGPNMVDETQRAKMRAILKDVQAGKFAAQLRAEAEAGYPQLNSLEKQEKASRLDAVRRRLDDLKGD